ncbi:MAG: DcaP family trimeric outer membrane transporter [Pseudomonadota bacterium]
MPIKARGCTAALAFAIAAGTTGQAHAATELELLRKQVQLLEQRLQELEQKEAENTEKIEETAEKADRAEEALETEVVKSGGSLGTFVLPGTDTRITIGGYAKGDFIYDFGGSIGSDDLFVPETIVIGGENDPKFTAHARQSRVNIRTTSPSSFGPVKTLIEGDFFGVGGNEVISNSFSFRLRHAWGELGPLAGGQFWTNFMPIEAYPTTVDFQGPAGIPFIRQAQLRWTQPVTDNFTVIGSLENSEFSGQAVDPADPTGPLISVSESIAPALEGLEAGIDVAPDAVLTGIYRDDFGLVRASGVARYFGNQGTADGGTFGWGFNVGANLNVTDSTKLLLSGTGGEGVGRYIINGFGLDGVIGLDGEIDPIGAYGVTAQLQQKLTESVTGAVAYGRYEVLDTFSPTEVETLQTVHGSLFWTPVDRVTLGAEIIFGMIEDQSGADDNAVRLQTSVQVNF